MPELLAVKQAVGYFKNRSAWRTCYKCEYIQLKNVVIMERVSLVGALFLLFGVPFFSVSKVYDKESLFEPICFCE